MKKLLIILPLIALLIGCQKKKIWVSEIRKAPYLYYEKDVKCDNSDKDGGYVTFETYMWDEGFPDTIIVEFTVNGRFQKYIKATRRGILEDSLGNAYSPAYVAEAYNGDRWVYDIRGKFVRFDADIADNDTRHYIPTYNP